MIVERLLGGYFDFTKARLDLAYTATEACMHPSVETIEAYTRSSAEVMITGGRLCLGLMISPFVAWEQTFMPSRPAQEEQIVSYTITEVPNDLPQLPEQIEH